MPPKVSPGFKGWVKHLASRTGALRWASQFVPEGAAILMYHSIQDEPARCADSIGAGIIHSTDAFRRQMELVAQHFNPVSVDDICSFLEGRGSLPRRAVAVTFDDGYADNYEVAAPILKRLGVPAAFYLTADFMDSKILPWFCRLRYAFSTTRRKEWCTPSGKVCSTTTTAERNAALLHAFDLGSSLRPAALLEMVESVEHDLDVKPLVYETPLMMNWNQAKSLQREGHIIGSHTLSHPNVAQVDPGQARWELLESKHQLEEKLASPVRHFSYPHPALNPHWSAETVKVTRDGGYRSAVTTSSGVVRKGHNPLALTRTWTPFTPEEFLWQLERVFLRRIVPESSRAKPAA